MAYRNFEASFLMVKRWAQALVLTLPLALPVDARAQSPRIPQSGASAGQATPPLVTIPRNNGRLHAADIGVVINTADPQSVRVGDYYIDARKLAPEQVLRVELPIRNVLTRDEFERLRAAIDDHFGRRTQALALAWTVPYAVECNAITGALALGFDGELCKNGCAPSRPSPYFNSATPRPLSAVGWRPSMLLAARNFEQAKALIDRGVASDGSLALRGRPPVNAMFLVTDDAPRRVRMALYPPPGYVQATGVRVQVAPAGEVLVAERVVLAITGTVRLSLSPTPDWVPGALADHLTSTGGDLFGGHGQSTVLEWIDSGVTASHGTVSEPCNHLQKFPHPQVLLGQYMLGATAIEAYWKSVAWPQQSLFVGEPLAAPFARR